MLIIGTYKNSVSDEKENFPEILENIKNQIKKERIKLSQITNKRAKEILKKLG